MPRSDLRIVLVADTHGLHGGVVVPDGDILVHAGDLCARGELEDIEAFSRWLGTLPHRHKIVIAGNHDFCLERRPAEAQARLKGCTYLRDSAVTIEGITFYGSPWQPWFHDWAFNLPRGRALAEKWEQIPDGTQVLVTHGPPRGHGDRTAGGERAGCDDLLARIRTVRPAVHVFGHIHEGYGVSREGGTLCVNASCCTLGYDPVNPPVVMGFRDGLFFTFP